MADEKKPIRGVLTGVEMFWMLLMPVSNFATIALISLSAAGYVDLLHACAAISAFYVLWALRNKIFAGNKLEKGHLTYGTVLAGALARNYALALVGVALVAGSIVYVLRVILPWPLSKLAHGERRRAILPRNSAAQSLTACHDHYSAQQDEIARRHFQDLSGFDAGIARRARRAAGARARAGPRVGNL